MKQYINPQGQVTTKPQYVYNQQSVPFQATEKVLLSFGWTINDLPDPEPQLTAADLLRQQLKDKQAEITSLKTDIASLDYIWIKCYEAEKLSRPCPYSQDFLAETDQKAENIRASINMKEEEIAELQSRIAELEPPVE